MTTAIEQAPRRGRGASSLPPRVVVVTRPTEYERLLQRHGTPQQVEFFLHTREQRIEPVREQHEQLGSVLQAVTAVVPTSWRSTRVDRADLDRFLFEPEDLVVAVGQDGLVANLAKYLSGQPVIGLNPDRERAATGHTAPEPRTMVSAQLDNSQELLALNEVFIGHRSHQSARYHIAIGEHDERHSSSGVIVSTGTGATGWARSIAASRATSLELPRPTDRQLVFFVREAWPSVNTGTDCVEGLIEDQDSLELVSRMDEGGAIFGDGIEADRIEFGWGRRLTVRVAQTCLNLV